MWLKEPNLRNLLARQRVIGNKQLQAKGFQLVRDGADLGVTVHGKTEERETLQTFYDGMP